MKNAILILLVSLSLTAPIILGGLFYGVIGSWAGVFISGGSSLLAVTIDSKLN